VTDNDTGKRREHYWITVVAYALYTVSFSLILILILVNIQIMCAQLIMLTHYWQVIFLPVIVMPSRITSTSASVIDHYVLLRRKECKM